MSSIFDKLGPVIKRYEEIEASMATPEIATDFEKIQELAKERASLEQLVGISRQHAKLAHDRDDLTAIIQEVIKRETGARGLRAIMEKVMLDPMYEIPSLTNVQECIITADCILKGEPPELVYQDSPEALSA